VNWKAWFVAGRFFVIPFLLVPFSLAANLIAGFDLAAWLQSMVAVGGIWISAHYINDWRDFVRGVDKFRGGSVAKAYTAASQILPAGLLTVRDCKLSALGFMICSLVVFVWFAPLRLDLLVLYLLGITLALTYTDWLKPNRFTPELTFFVAFALVPTIPYTWVRGFDQAALSLGFLGGMIGLLGFAVDQLPDVRRVTQIRNLAELLFKTKIRLTEVVWFFVTAIYVLQMGFVLLGWLPTGSLLTIFALPLSHIASIFLSHEVGKGQLLILAWVTIYWLLLGFGATILSTTPP